MISDKGLICFAYPTMGKTTFVRNHSTSAYDLDFGGFMESFVGKWTPQIKEEFKPVYTKLCDSYLEIASTVASLGKIVFINEIKHVTPSLLHNIKDHIKIVVLVPAYDKNSFISRFKNRANCLPSKQAAEHLKWAFKLAEGFDSDKKFLKEFALQNKLTYTEVEYVSDYFDALQQ